MTRHILHADLDAFYASIEQRDNRAIRGKPVIVGGSPKQRGVVAAASYEARNFGVHSAMPMKTAIRLCPQAIRMLPRFDVYRQTSRQIMAIFRLITPLIEPLSLDEAFLDITDQIETFFIRLMRGSSSRGLTCMESIKFLYGKQIGRPLLNIEKSDIKLYQKNNSIEFIEDETNKLLKFDRNFIRSEIIPVLKSRWTSMNKVMKNNIKQQKINFSTISDFINHKLKDCFDRTKNRLIIEKVLKEKEYVQFSLIHEWVNINTSTLLSFNQVYEVINNIVKSKNDSTPLFAFQNFLIRKYG